MLDTLIGYAQWALGITATLAIAGVAVYFYIKGINSQKDKQEKANAAEIKKDAVLDSKPDTTSGTVRDSLRDGNF